MLLWLPGVNTGKVMPAVSAASSILCTWILAWCPIIGGQSLVNCR